MTEGPNAPPGSEGPDGASGSDGPGTPSPPQGPTRPGRSFQETLKEGQRLLGSLESLRSQVSDRVSAKHSELEELTQTHQQLDELKRQIDGFYKTQLQWADERQHLLEEVHRLQGSHAKLLDENEKTRGRLAAAVNEANQSQVRYDEAASSYQEI